VHDETGGAYLQHLSDSDLELLATGIPDFGGVANPAATIRSRPGMVADLLGHPSAYASVFQPTVDTDVFVTATPFLVFAVAVHRTADDLAGATHVSEWLGPRQRVPVLDVSDLRDFLAGPWRRLFLIELLASYTHVASGSVFVSTRRGWRRQRFSELDPVRLAGLLEVVPDAERPGIYRRLGDVALFLTGVFPDHTARQGFGPIAEGRLLRAGRIRRPDDATLTGGAAGMGDAGAVGLLEQLGRRWYRLAHDTIPSPVPADVRVLGEVAERFGEARRILNLVTDTYLFPFRDRWFRSSAD
jgi:hypothetical protein